VGTETRRRAVAVLPWAVCGAALVVVAVGLALHGAGVTLGTSLPPFVMTWRPSVAPWVAVSVAVAVGAVAGMPVLAERLPGELSVGAALYALSLTLGLAVNLAARGARGWYGVFATGAHGSFEGKFEYLPGRPLLHHGIGYFLRHFGSLLYYSTTHIKGNPPGPLIALRLLDVHTAPQFAALCVAVGSLCAPLAYDLGRQLSGEQRGRVAGLLTACSPAVLLFGVSSADYAFAALGMIATCLLVRRGWWLVPAALAYAIAAFFSWLLIAVAPFAALLTLQRRGWRAACGVLLAGAAGLAVWNGGLAVADGYDPFAALRATSRFYHHGVAATRPYAFWVFGSPAAWIVMAGAPIAFLSLRALARRDPAAVALWAMVAAASLLGLTKAETERIWLPFAPLLCVAAASALPLRRMRPLLAALIAQALVVEVLFFTIW
jgi:hypothetical protein